MSTAAIVEHVDVVSDGGHGIGARTPDQFLQLRLQRPGEALDHRVEAPMCQESVSGCRAGGARVMVTEQRVVDLACHEAREAADDVLFAQTLRGASRDVIQRGLPVPKARRFAAASRPRVLTPAR